ncbi:lytic polysaccharide monooxygenase [Trametes coccinea BRFM310]|uniref:lytic cellulose monooxygenase (C4-dehydrogenating) n=1 Tax=Trametes coccinea (strain BRFM310) TaxID=1353009 RepID=A0A1Y2IFI2_TRAC3|nr:lytic polysaccharide monooxygenase [Trametes coccinea BRFM310]
MFPTSSLLLTSLFALVPYVSAHGFVADVAIDGKSYDGNAVGPSPSIDSPIRSINNNGPVKSVTDPNLACGLGSTAGAVVAPANPGSTISFHWLSGNALPGQNWIHEVGPVLTYMAKCEGTTCDKFDATNAQWFKIAEDGKVNSTTWVQKDVIAAGKPYTTKIPENLEPGQYLIRNEIISLQGAQNPGGAEFYPSCTQLNIGGNGNLVPNATTKTADLYRADDSGIRVDVFTPGPPYVMPGPPIAALVPDNGQNSDSGDNTSPSASSQDPSSATPSTSAMSSGSVSVADNAPNQCACGNSQPAASSSGTDAAARSSPTVSSASSSPTSEGGPANDAQSTGLDDSANVVGVAATTLSGDASTSSSASGVNGCGQSPASRRRRFVRRSASSGHA